MKKLINRNGFSLIEIIIVISLVMFVFFLFALSQKFYFTQSSRNQNHIEIEVGLIQVANHLMKIGRLGNPCAKVAAPLSLECDVQFPTGPAKIRFMHSGTELLFQKWDGATWVTQKVHPNILNFEICNDIDMSNGPCPLLPSKINSAHTENRNGGLGQLATPANRFYRFRLRAGIQNVFERILQASFFVRNPTSVAGVEYTWETLN